MLDLKELKDAQGLKGLDGLRVSSQNVDLGKEKVHLVDGTEAHGRYVTLSHCWGKPKSIQGKLRLTGKTEQKFRREGIQLRDLCQVRDFFLRTPKFECNGARSNSDLRTVFSGCNSLCLSS